MTLPAGRVFSRKTIRAFSLVELLLAISLIILLLGAVAFNFSGAQQGAELDEGASQFESLIRFAKAHAANSGRRVRMTFEEDVGDGLLVPIGNVEVSWEPDPLGLPEQFVQLPETAAYVKSILDLVTIEDVRPLATPTPAAVSGAMDSSTATASDSAAVTVTIGEEDGLLFGFPPIIFYPDGSSDSAEITIAARNGEGEDKRRVTIRLVGFTGGIRRHTWKAEDLTESEEGPGLSQPSSAAGTGGVGE